MITIAYVETLGELIGGGPMSLLTIIHNLDRTRYNPVLVFYSRGPLPQTLSTEGFEVHIIERRSKWSDLFLILRLSLFFKRRKVNLVHVNSLDIRAGLAARLARIPLVGHLRVIFPFTAIDRLFVRLATRVVSVSDAVRDHFCNTHAGLASKFTTIPNSVMVPDSLPHIDIRKELGLPRNAVIVGSVSRIDPWKGLHIFVEMASKLSECANRYFLLLGGVDEKDPEAVAYRERLKTQVRENGLSDRFWFLGFRADALSAIREMDVLVVSSLLLETPSGLKTEGFGRVIVEAMAVGTPVVATRVGGIPEIVEDGDSGLLVPPEDAVEMADAVESILTDSALARRLSDGGKRRYETRYHILTHIQQLQALYQKNIVG